MKIKFTDQSKGNPTSWAWEFGDGAVSAVPSPEHTYSGDGPYNAKLTVARLEETSVFTRSVGLAPAPAACDRDSPGSSAVPLIGTTYANSHTDACACANTGTCTCTYAGTRDRPQRRYFRYSQNGCGENSRVAKA